jgi:hypothetical protein
LAGLAWLALRSFLASLLGMTLTGIVLAGLSYYVLRDHWGYAVIGAVLAVIEAVLLGFVVGAKRAVVLAVAHGLNTLQLGRTIVRLVFDKILGVAQQAGSPSGVAARTVERIPLARAEELLKGAIRGVLGETGQGGWLRQQIQAALVAAVDQYTLARFREEAAAHGGIDLAKVQDELEQTIDERLVSKLRGGIGVWTALLVVALPLVVAVQTWILVLLARQYG